MGKLRESAFKFISALLAVLQQINVDI